MSNSRPSLRAQQNKSEISNQRIDMFNYIARGDEYFAHGQYKQAIDDYTEAAGFCSESKTHPYTAAMINSKIAFTYIELVKGLQRRAATLDSDTSRRAKAENELASITSDINYYQSHNLLQSREIQEQIKDRVIRYFYFEDTKKYNLEQQRINLNLVTKHLKSALKQFESHDRLRAHEEQKQPIDITNTYFTLASTYKIKNKLQKALMCSLEKGLAKNESISYPNNQPATEDYKRELVGIYNVISCFQQLGLYKNTIPFYQRAIEIHSQLEIITQQTSSEIPHLQSYLQQMRATKGRKKAYQPYKKTQKVSRTLSAENDARLTNQLETTVKSEHQPTIPAPTTCLSLLRQHSVLKSDNNKKQKREIDPAVMDLFNFKL